ISASRPGQYPVTRRVADLSGRAGVLAEEGAEDRDRQRPWAGRGTTGSGGQLRSAALAGVRLWPAAWRPETGRRGSRLGRRLVAQRRAVCGLASPNRVT